MVLSSEEIHLIEAAVKRGGDIWNDETLLDIKRKIKLYCLGLTTDQCCYCRTDFTAEFMMVIDIEHVLPKSIFGAFMFELFNLSVSCKRCNMNIKRERTDFLLDVNQVHLQPQNAGQYFFSHPNLDNYFDNIEYFFTARNDKKIIKYTPLTDKGRFTYDFFKLNQKEVETLNEAQGVKPAENELSENIPQDLVNDTKQLLNQLKSQPL
ncbi:HNH endonuclease [Chitinophaga sp. SYP-B3965]|uniref:HNH endonuclease n=1 Tax=Chitinophaga sp. SYP-B3965 TaxID=2663120 RepID=UPI00129A0A48|nr:HNH endonuclease [Chitinophaga sp. SYP-B3965]MRG45345.1 HNH endonuclease [Chitinophaga sp. SYP-B3965]